MSRDLFSDLERLDEHWRANGSSLVAVLDRLGQQGHGLPPLPPEGTEPEPEAEAG